MTPFSVYQGKYNAAYRDIEAEIIPMCEDQGMAIVPWAALGGGQLMSSQERKQKEKDPDARKNRGFSENDLKVCNVLEQIAENKSTTLQAVVCPLPIRNLLVCYHANTIIREGLGLSISAINLCLSYCWGSDR